MNLGKLGVRLVSDALTASGAASAAQYAEKLGYGTVWIPEAMGRNVYTHAAWLLAKTARINIAAGIANIYARDPMATVGAQYALNEQSDGRFLLGLGVSHAPLVEGARLHTYEKPVTAMAAYLQDMAKVQYGAPPPAQKPKTIIAALGPKMMETAGKYADGAHPLFTTAQHTAEARKILGPGKLLCPELIIVLESDPAKARDMGRKQVEMFLQLDNYRNSMKRQGFSATEVESLSDRLIDGIVAWGPVDKIRAQIQEFFDAGADHLILHPVPFGTNEAAPDKVLELLAPGR